VGAIIVGERGYVLGGGWNEVAEGQIGCGDRTIRDIKNINDIPIEMHGKEEFRIFLLNKYKDDFDRHFCYREEYEQFKRTMKYDRKKSDKGKSNIEQDERSSSNVKAQQYCRALHAEENAIIQTAKIGGMGLRNTTIYTTTFPCELCAKKIYQAGISRIIYSEPYPEALSEDVFLNDGIRKIEIEPFEGVKSHSYYRLFRPSINRKDYQKILAKM
jgi:deoxycytidylate deaminase